MFLVINMQPKANKSQVERAKKAAAEQAIANEVQDGMIIGLGTGSTAAFLIQALIERVKQGLNIQAVSSSDRSEKMAKEGGISILDLNDVSHIDVTIDGADEFDPSLCLIKGGGGALFREKLVAINSKRMVVIADPSKRVQTLGQFPLPVEVLPFGYKKTCSHIEQLGHPGSIRMHNGNLYITDNQNYIYDLSPQEIADPEALHDQLLKIPGVVETGLFIGIANAVYLGHYDGTAEVVQK